MVFLGKKLGNSLLGNDHVGNGLLGNSRIGSGHGTMRKSERKRESERAALPCGSHVPCSRTVDPLDKCIIRCIILCKTHCAQVA